MPEDGDETGPREAPQRPLLIEVQHHGSRRRSPHEEGDDAVLACLGALHDAFVAVDPHARSVAPGYDIPVRRRTGLGTAAAEVEEALLERGVGTDGPARPGAEHAESRHDRGHGLEPRPHHGDEVRVEGLVAADGSG